MSCRPKVEDLVDSITDLSMEANRLREENERLKSEVKEAVELIGSLSGQSAWNEGKSFYYRAREFLKRNPPS